MEIIKTKYLRIILFASASVVFLNAIIGGQQFVSDRLPIIASSAIELIVHLCECLIAYSFFVFFKDHSDKLLVTLSKFIFVGKAALLLLFLFHWTEVFALITIEGIISFLVLAAIAIWSFSLFLKENSDNDSFKAAKLFATFSLLSVFCSFVISFNLLQSTDFYENVAAGKTIIYYIPQFILALPYLVLFKFILTLKSGLQSQTASN